MESAPQRDSPESPAGVNPAGATDPREFASASAPRAEDFWGEASAAMHDALQAPPVPGEQHRLPPEADERPVALRRGMRRCSEAVGRVRGSSGRLSPRRPRRSSSKSKPAADPLRERRRPVLPLMATVAAAGLIASALGVARLAASSTAGRVHAPQRAVRRSEPLIAAKSGLAVLHIPAHRATHRPKGPPASFHSHPGAQIHNQQPGPDSAAPTSPSATPAPTSVAPSEPVSTYTPQGTSSSSPAAVPSGGTGNATSQTSQPAGPVGPGAAFGPGKLG